MFLRHDPVAVAAEAMSWGILQGIGDIGVVLHFAKDGENKWNTTTKRFSWLCVSGQKYKALILVAGVILAMPTDDSGSVKSNFGP